VPVHTWTIQTTAKDVWNKLSVLFDASRNANSHWHLLSVCVCVCVRVCMCVYVDVDVVVVVGVGVGVWVWLCGWVAGCLLFCLLKKELKCDS